MRAGEGRCLSYFKEQYVSVAINHILKKKNSFLLSSPRGHGDLHIQNIWLWDRIAAERRTVEPEERECA